MRGGRRIGPGLVPAWAMAIGLAACAGAVTSSPGSDVDAASVDGPAAPRDAPPAPSDAPAAPSDAPPPECQWGGAPGSCLTTAACSALPDHSPYPGSCASGLSCCIVTPSVADNPPAPAGWKLMAQAQVTAEMTAWAVAILHDPVTYPMFATTTRVFGSLMVLARVEWHPPDFQNGAVHRGVTLYVPR